MNRWLLACVLLCGFAGSAVAADMGVLGPYQPPPIAPLYSWTGCYIGVNMGGGASPISNVDTLGTFAPSPGSMGDLTARGVLGGGQLGCDYQAGSFVFGLQGLVDLSGMKGSDVLPTTILVNNSYVQTVATFTGRVGYTVLPTLLLYGKFGGAFVHDIYHISVPDGEDVPIFPGTMRVAPATAISSTAGTASLVEAGAIVAQGASSTTGWTAGFGGEWAFAHAPVSLSLEYDYLGFRSVQVPFTSAIVLGQIFPINISQKIHMVLFGVNLRFGGGSGF